MRSIAPALPCARQTGGPWQTSCRQDVQSEVLQFSRSCQSELSWPKIAESARVSAFPCSPERQRQSRLAFSEIPSFKARSDCADSTVRSLPVCTQLARNSWASSPTTCTFVVSLETAREARTLSQPLLRCRASCPTDTPTERDLKAALDCRRAVSSKRPARAEPHDRDSGRVHRFVVICVCT